MFRNANIKSLKKKKKALFKLNKMIRTLKLIELGKKFRVCLAKVSLIEV